MCEECKQKNKKIEELMNIISLKASVISLLRRQIIKRENQIFRIFNKA